MLFKELHSGRYGYRQKHVLHTHVLSRTFNRWKMKYTVQAFIIFITNYSHIIQPPSVFTIAPPAIKNVTVMKSITFVDSNIIINTSILWNIKFGLILFKCCFFFCIYIKVYSQSKFIITELKFWNAYWDQQMV